MRRISIDLGQRQCETLDRLAANEGTSRAALIRRVLDRWLEGRDRDCLGALDAIDASFGVGDVGDELRRPDGREEHLTRMWRLGA